MQCSRNAPPSGASKLLDRYRQSLAASSSRRDVHCKRRCRRATRVLKPQASAVQGSQVAQNLSSYTSEDFVSLFESLAEAVAGPGRLVTAGTTRLGRGLVAQTAVPPGKALLSVAPANILCVTDQPEGPGGNAFGRRALAEWQGAHGNLPPLLVSYLLGSDRSADWFYRLCAWLLWLSKNGSRTWQAYTALLPRESEMSCLMNFRPEELSELQSSSLESLARRERKSIMGVHELTFNSTSGELKGLRLADHPDETVWAACCVNSRCFSDVVGEEELSMLVPCADMANHLPHNNASYRFSPEHDCFQIVSERPIEAGQEACINYGWYTKSNEDLMRDSGFVLPGNPNDRIAFGGQKAQFGALLAAASSGLGSGTSGGGSRPASGGAGRHLHLGRLLGALQVPARVREGRLELPAVPATPTHGRGTAVLMSLQDHLAQSRVEETEAALQAERQCVQQLLDECRGMLRAHATSIETDEALLRGEEGPLAVRRRAAVASRLERKRLIQVAVDALTRYAEKLS